MKLATLFVPELYKPRGTYRLQYNITASPYIKRSRTLYKNLLEKEAAKGRDLKDQDLREADIRAFSHKVTTCIRRINEFKGKLDSCDERMSLEGNGDHEQ